MQISRFLKKKSFPIDQVWNSFVVVCGSQSSYEPQYIWAPIYLLVVKVILKFELKIRLFKPSSQTGWIGRKNATNKKQLAKLLWFLFNGLALRIRMTLLAIRWLSSLREARNFRILIKHYKAGATESAWTNDVFTCPFAAVTWSFSLKNNFS